ncbi:MAG: hypothetical protein HY355_01995, partial [Armatimonadetes bacterium]|nr:hypothetical protein [Armatimonadota bacterium]
MATSGTSCPRCGRPSPGGALCAGCERRSLLEALAAAVPGDPLRYLRQKVLDDGLTVAELARELAWDEGVTRRLLKSAQRHLWMAERTRRLGQALNAWYRGSAAGILMNVLAIILGFGIASAWQA